MKSLHQTGDQKLQAKHKNNKPILPAGTRTLKLLLVPVIFIVVFKLLFMFITSYQPDVSSPAINLTPNVSAQEQALDSAQDPQTPQAESPATVTTENQNISGSYRDPEWDPAFIQELKKREDNVKRKETSLDIQKQHLLQLKRQIEQKIEKLEKIEKNISKLLAQKEQVENEKLKKLAKVFEATPPEQAGTLMSQLEVDIAAQLLLNMTGRKAGKIWGYVNPDSAVKISKRLSEIKPDFRIGTTPEQTEK